MFSEECKYFLKDKNIPMYSNDDLEISPDYDEENSDEENSDKKNSDTKNSDERTSNEWQQTIIKNTMKSFNRSM